MYSFIASIYMIQFYIINWRGATDDYTKKDAFKLNSVRQMVEKHKDSQFKIIENTEKQQILQF